MWAKEIRKLPNFFAKLESSRFYERISSIFIFIAKICVKLADPSTRLHQLEVTLLSPFRPQLADRVSLAR